MKEYTLTRTRIKSGHYEGLLTTRAKVKAQPVLELRLLDATLCKAEIIPDEKVEKAWAVQIELPAASINDGVQTYIIYDVETGKTLDSFAMITGTPLQQDIQAELALLRAELDILKQAFRQHCVETAN